MKRKKEQKEKMTRKARTRRKTGKPGETSVKPKGKLVKRRKTNEE